MQSNTTVLIINVTILLSIATCTIVGLVKGVDGWGYSYLMLLGLMSNRNEGDENAK